jgi:hypothetical protein
VDVLEPCHLRRANCGLWCDAGSRLRELEKDGAAMTPQFFVDDLGQVNAWSYMRNHYVVGIGLDKAQALARWNEALKAAK